MKKSLLSLSILSLCSFSSCNNVEESPEAPEETRAPQHASNIVMLSDLVTKGADAQAAFAATVSQGFVIVDFYADWCPPCKSLGKTIQSIASTFPTITFLKVNIDTYKDIASSHGVMSIPVLKFYANGSEVHKSVGALSATSLRSMIQEKFNDTAAA